MAQREGSKVLRVEISTDVVDAIDSLVKEEGKLKWRVVEDLLRKALGTRVQQQKLF